jgi:hypothetical protein
VGGVSWVGVALWHLPYQSDGRFTQSKTITEAVGLWHRPLNPLVTLLRRSDHSPRHFVDGGAAATRRPLDGAPRRAAAQHC